MATCYLPSSRHSQAGLLRIKAWTTWNQQNKHWSSSWPGNIKDATNAGVDHQIGICELLAYTLKEIVNLRALLTVFSMPQYKCPETGGRNDIKRGVAKMIRKVGYNGPHLPACCVENGQVQECFMFNKVQEGVRPWIFPLTNSENCNARANPLERSTMMLIRLWTMLECFFSAEMELHQQEQ